MIGTLVDEQTGEETPAIIEAGVRSVANLDLRSGEEDAGDRSVSLGRTRAGNSFTAEIPAAAVGNTFLAMTLANAESLISASDLTVLRDGEQIALIPATFDEYGNQTNNANFFADAGVCYFAPDIAGSYTITCTSSIESVDVMQTQVFASLDADGTTLAQDEAHYEVKDTDPDAHYKVQLVFGKTEGAGDTLIGETELLTGSGAYNGVIDYTLEGSLLPTGDYYPSILLLEYIEAEGENGQTVGTWSLIGQKSFAQALHYVNDMIPASPANITLAYSGNRTMTASWDAVEGASIYQIAVYDEEGADTGLLFRTSDASTSLIMDLSSLEENEAYSIGVKAIIYDENDAFRYGYEGRSDSAILAAAAPPAVMYSDNVLPEAGNKYSLLVGAQGGSFTVSCTKPLNFTVSSPSAVIASVEGQNEIAVQIPEPDGSATLTLTVVATDPDSGDYALNTIEVTFDTVAPPLMLDDLGVFPVDGTDAGEILYITGQSEAGANIYVYKKENFGDPEELTSLIVPDDGNFFIPVDYSEEIELTVRAMDAAGNLSAALQVHAPEKRAVVTFDAQGGSCATASIAVARETTIGLLPKAYLTDQCMIGWFTEPEGGTQIDETTVFYDDAKVYAHYGNGIVITFGLCGEDALCTATVLLKKLGEPLGTLPVPVPANNGRMFLGWFTAANGGEQVTENTVFTTGETITIFAHWTDCVVVSFDAGLGSCATDELKVPVGAAIAEYPVPVSDGYTFIGWYVGEDAVTAETVYTADVTLFAKWVRTTETFEVSQHGCEVGEDLPDPVYTVPEGTIVTITYTGTGATGYLSSAKPTAAGTYKVTVVYFTFEKAYVGSAEFRIGRVYAIGIDAGVSGGSISVQDSAAEEETVIVTVTPDPSCELLTLTVMNGSEELVCTAIDVTHYSFTMPAGNVTVSAVFGHTGDARGDVDGDGIVNITDVTALLNYLATSGTNNPACDVDGDGIVNITDVTALLNVLAGTA